MIPQDPIPTHTTPITICFYPFKCFAIRVHSAVFALQARTGVHFALGQGVMAFCEKCVEAPWKLAPVCVDGSALSTFATGGAQAPSGVFVARDILVHVHYRNHFILLAHRGGVMYYPQWSVYSRRTPVLAKHAQELFAAHRVLYGKAAFAELVPGALWLEQSIENGWDCGVYVAMLVWLIAKGPLAPLVVHFRV